MRMQYLRAVVCASLLFPLTALAAPRILYTDILTGPNTGGENNCGAFLTVFGSGFGVSGQATINGSSAGIKRWTDTQVTIQPCGASSGAIKITSGGQDSNTDHVFTVVAGDIIFVTAAQTVQSALDQAGPGDHIVIRGGTRSDNFGQYGSFFSIHHMGGTAAAPLVVMGYPGESVLFNRTNQSRGFHTYLSPGHFVIANLKINANQGTAAIDMGVGTTNIRVVNNEVYGYYADSGGAAAIDGSGKQFRVFGNHVHDNGGSKLYHAMYFDARDTSGPDDIEIAYNHIHHQTGGRGVQIYGDTGALIRNVRVHHNLIHDIALDGIIFSRDTATGMKAYNNIVYRTAVTALRGTSNDVGSSGGCIRFAGTATVAEVYNNTFVDCAVDGDPESGAFRFESGAQVIIRNNLIMGKYSNAVAPPANRTISNNLWFGAGAAPSWDTSPVTGDPRFIDVSVKNYRLGASSAAIDRGVALNGVVTNDYDGNPRPQGSGYDVGAFESSGVMLPTPQNLQIRKN